jgi:hypothetical protein
MPAGKGPWEFLCCRCKDKQGSPYCYAVVRQDLPLVHQAVQAAHACVEAGRSGLIPEDIEHPHLIICRVADESALRLFALSLQARGIRCALFCEPDRENQATALCTEPVFGAQRGVFRSLSLLSFATVIPAESPGGGGCASEAQ